MDQRWLTCFFKIASVISEQSRCQRAKVGCVLVRDKRIVSVGYNGVMRGTNKHCDDGGCILDHTGSHCISLHAEANSIASAAQIGVSTEKTTAVVTLEPCINCVQLLVNAGVNKIYFNRYYKPKGENKYFSDKTLLELLVNQKQVDIMDFWNYVEC